jgi:hypothetical protein
VFAQYVIKADSVKLTNYDSSELILENHTQNVPGYLYNKGNGRTEFRKALIPINDTLYLFGKDTLNINKGLKYYSVSGGSGSGSAAASRIYKVYAQDFSGTTLTHTFNLIGWNVDYSSVIDTAHTIVSTIDIEITLPVNIPAGTVVTVQFQGTTIYTMTVSSTLSAEHYAIGTVKINQDIKYANMFYVKGAAETITGAGVITTTNTAYRLYPASFTNPTLTFTVSGTTSTVRVGATYTIDKKGPGSWLFN